MPSLHNRTYLPATREAAELLGKLIRLERRERKMSEEDLAGRAGIARRTLQRIEHGDPQCAIGLFFELAVLVGVRLFDSDDHTTLAERLDRVTDKLAVLPRRVRSSALKVDDDF
ncbi:helix-turn-helix transcriptional regulator [Oryzomonas sagensis]|uniref:Helix-turn-helix transcriptional regulator n=1 Tax=Oryzomonas sagensis TaxID=2603857 RepID=A0ABQ6TNT5_9BACT|nr:helix-turn-helix transcriptional regulator [Oryzomonas sagensis]KAB0670306.1 helix-turn-helix transcriptional regulator [Oryzomonas sagensis]